MELNKLKLSELRKIGKEKKLKGFSYVNKDELIEMIEKNKTYKELYNLNIEKNNEKNKDKIIKMLKKQNEENNEKIEQIKKQGIEQVKKEIEENEKKIAYYKEQNKILKSLNFL